MTIAQGTRVKVTAGEHEGQYGTVINDRLDVMLDDDHESTHFAAEDLTALVPTPHTITTDQTIYYTA